MIRGFRCCHAHFVHPTRQARPSRLPSASPRLESGAVTPSEQYQCVPSIQIGNLTFHNWKKSDRGFLNFVQALTESCDTWFYQVGIKTGAEPIIDWAQKTRLRRQMRNSYSRRSGRPRA